LAATHDQAWTFRSVGTLVNKARRHDTPRRSVPAPKRWSFRVLMRLVRRGDADAAAELVRRFEPIIQKAVRGPLICFALQRDLDPNDISQMVLARFFLENWARRRDFEHAEQLSAWLLQLTRSRLRKELRRRGGVERASADDDRLQTLMDWVLERHS
jgi:hypothetical protein